MKFTFCIVTRNRSASLHRTVMSILAGAVGRDIEILVIDNSEPREFAQNKKICQLDARIKQIQCSSKIGIAALRQVGVQESGGDVIAFIDDDVELPPEWLDTATNAFQGDHNLGIYGCRVHNVDFEGKIDGYETHGFPKRHGSNGAFKPTDQDDQIVTFGEFNLALRKKIVLDAGGFDCRFKWGYEGADLTHRMLARGCAIRYNRQVIIKHYFNEYRSRPKFNWLEYYRFLYFFKYYGMKDFSLSYELKRIYYFSARKDFVNAIVNVFCLLAIPFILIEARRLRSTSRRVPTADHQVSRT